jgi:hypothetical protein
VDVVGCLEGPIDELLELIGKNARELVIVRIKCSCASWQLVNDPKPFLQHTHLLIKLKSLNFNATCDFHIDHIFNIQWISLRPP